MLKKMVIVTLTLAYTALCACGTKGPLYIPEQRYPQGVPKVKPATPAPQNATQTNPQ